jgi:hypothetical protein
MRSHSPELSGWQVPVAASVNDALQIVWGMATGYDYAGHPMSAGDYALRGVGIVIGVLPAGQAIVRVGGEVIDRAFVVGSRTIRELGLGRRVAVDLRSAPSAVADVASAVGAVLDNFRPQTAREARELASATRQVTAAAALADPLQDRRRHELGSVVRAQVARSTSDTYQPRQHVDHATGSDAASNIDRQCLPRPFVDDRQALDLLAAGACVEDEVVRPDLIGTSRRQRPRPAVTLPPGLASRLRGISRVVGLRSIQHRREIGGRRQISQ